MNIIINGKHITLTEGLTAHAREKFAKLEQYFDHIIEIDVTLGSETTKAKADSKTCEVTVYANGAILRGSETHEDLYAAIDLVLEKLERQLKRYNDKIKKQPKRDSRIEKASHATHHVISLDDHDMHTSDSPRVVRSKKFALKPMYVDEAAMQLDLLGQDFVVFSNAKTNEVNVVYRRSDKNIGLIEPNF